ncbi:DUF494 family protein [Photobacterium minamisatsumaniensis]|uniref:DUF494 family protein n=1 Tax=Photobacterium minamisatsumaniensis TaxID=2910233 RepID=UPI003D148FD1
MMDILMYLFETYIQSDAELMVDQDELSEELLRAGFHQEDIYKALSWLEKLAALQETEITPYMNTSAVTSVRIYTELEMTRLDVFCRGFLIYLEQVHVLGADTREMVIDRVMELDTADFSLDDLKWIILMVLFNAPGNESAYSQMEELLYGIEDEYIH